MKDNIKTEGTSENNIVEIALDHILKIGAIFLVVFLCFRIVRPFLGIIIWALLIAIILYPLLSTISPYLWGRKKITAALMTVVMLAILVLPSIWLVIQLVDGVKFLADSMPGGSLRVPPPSESVATWPIIGPWLYETGCKHHRILENLLRDSCHRSPHGARGC